MMLSAVTNLHTTTVNANVNASSTASAKTPSSEQKLG
jgi:hypothetical protein